MRANSIALVIKEGAGCLVQGLPLPRAAMDFDSNSNGLSRAA